MALYDTIFKRRSVRSFSKAPVNDDLIAEIKKHIEEIEQLNGYRTRMEILTGEQIDGSASHYVVAYCEASLGDYINVGYCMESVDLFIQGLGLGSLWLGGGRPKKIKDENYCIVMAFGNTDVPLRFGENDFSRLSIREISNEDNAVARAVRLAPSARNNQPWQLNFADRNLVINYRGRGLLRGVFKKKLSKIDMGIALRFAELAYIRYGEEVNHLEIIDGGNSFAVRITH
jgi:hypothetical protein